MFFVYKKREVFFFVQWSWGFVLEFAIVAYGASESWFTLVHVIHNNKHNRAGVLSLCVMLDKHNFFGFLLPQPDKLACENLKVGDRGPKQIIFDEPEYISGDWNAMRIYKTKKLYNSYMLWVESSASKSTTSMCCFRFSYWFVNIEIWKSLLICIYYRLDIALRFILIMESLAGLVKN